MTDRELTQAEVDSFIAALTDLTRKHGIAIDGCGCCGSPYLKRCDDQGKYSIMAYSVGDDTPWTGLDFDSLEYKHE